MHSRHLLQISSKELANKVLIGGAINLLLIGLFLLTNHQKNPEWSNLWFIKPLVIVPIAGAIGGAFYYYLTRYMRLILPKTVLICAGIVFFIVILWIGAILGLNGTYWN